MAFSVGAIAASASRASRAPRGIPTPTESRYTLTKEERAYVSSDLFPKKNRYNLNTYRIDADGNFIPQSKVAIDAIESFRMTKRRESEAARKAEKKASKAASKAASAARKSEKKASNTPSRFRHFFTRKSTPTPTSTSVGGQKRRRTHKRKRTHRRKH